MDNNMERIENDSIFDNIEPIDLTFVDTKEESDFIKDPSFNIFDNNLNNDNNINNQNLNYQNNINEFNNMGLNDLVNESIEIINQEEKDINFNNNSFENFTNYDVNTSNDNNPFNQDFNSFGSNQNDLVDYDSDIEIIDDYINQDNNLDNLTVDNSIESFNMPTYNENIVTSDNQNSEFMNNDFQQNFQSFNQANIDLTSSNNEVDMFETNTQVDNSISFPNSQEYGSNISINEELVVNPMEFNTNLPNNNETLTSAVELNNNLVNNNEAFVNPVELNNNLVNNNEVVTNPVEFDTVSDKEIAKNKDEMSDEVLLKKAVKELIVLSVIIAITIFSLPTIYDIIKGNDNVVTNFINNVKNG